MEGPDITENHHMQSKDSLFGGELICFQHISGYRFSIDAVLIAHFVEVRKDDRILDMGTGCGIIMMILLYRWRNQIKEISGIEIQQELANLAHKNLCANNFDRVAKVIRGDIKEIASVVGAESFDTIVCNPPFYTSGSGRHNENEEANLARHQILATLDDFLRASAAAVRNKGSVYYILPAEQVGSFITQACKYRLEVKRLQFTYGYPEEKNDARLVLIHCMKNGGPGTKVLPPLYVYQGKNGVFSEDLSNFYKKNSEM